ncbi:MAG: fatty acid desaturase [Caulobacter sp.]|nr:fatty acid desaturase [Caulobacter sp.]
MPTASNPLVAAVSPTAWDRARAAAPTVALAILIHGGWLLATLFHRSLPWPVQAALGGWLIAWHGSLQHETIHGHPTPWRGLNTLLAAAPLNLWLPYERYRASHLAHHAAERLTDPVHDPESRYLARAVGRPRRVIAGLQATLAGRILVGPAIEVGGFLIGEARALARDVPSARRAWAIHLVTLVPVLAWLVGICGLGLADYLLTFVYPGVALSLIRSFAEHRAAAHPDHQAAIVEHAPILGLLFLNNNLHAAHHAWPAAPWRALPGLYAAHREALLAANDGLVYRGYGEVFRRFLFRAHDDLVHPAQAAS